MIEPTLRVSDIKQYQYCPRVVYYQYVLPVDRKVTYKMEKGKVAQEEIEELEARRKLGKYGLKEGKRTFNPWLNSRKLGLSGKLDLLIEANSERYPVDFKFTRGRPYKNHLYQLGGYALIIEDKWEKSVQKGIRMMITEERFPDPPSHRSKCVDCEYQNYCRDIW